MYQAGTSPCTAPPGVDAAAFAPREAEIANRPFLGALAECSARRSERSVASHISEEQRRNAPVSAAKNGILAFSASLSRTSRNQTSKTKPRLYAGFVDVQPIYVPANVLG